MSGKERDSRIGRRAFLRLVGAGLASLYAGCHGVSSYSLRYDCGCSEDGILRVMSYNIANARGNTDDLWVCRPESVIRQNLDGIIGMIRQENVDIVCMNEVDFDSFRTHNIDQAEYIAEGLGYEHVLKETIFGVPSTLELGNAVVSRYPLEANHHRQYGTDFGERVRHVFKSFVDFDVMLPGRGLNFVLTHLESESADIRDEEVTVLLEYLTNKDGPFVLIGDFNSGPGCPEFDRITGSGMVHNRFLGLPSYPSNLPGRSIDHILVSGSLNISNYRTISLDASDHCPVLGDIRL